jgi:ketosteroid isomerase-like protein
MDAFEHYYADNVVMQDNNAEPREGKEACRKYEENFLASLKEFHNGGVLKIAFNEDDQVAMIESFMEVTFQDGNRVKMIQTAVQQWDGDKVVHEKFYYGN